MTENLTELFDFQKGHFLLESGHHGELWLDLELLCLHPNRLRPHAIELANLLAGLDIQAVCGPLVEGAFVGLIVAEELDVSFTYSEPILDRKRNSLYPKQYRIPRVLRSNVEGKRVAIVNDVVNAGSAVRGTHADLLDCGAEVVGMGALVVLGDFASSFAAESKLALHSLAFLSNSIWEPEQCPFCARGIPLDNPAAGSEDSRQR